MRSLRLAGGIAAVALLAPVASGVPLGIRIDDHDFTFDVPYWAAQGWGAQYDFNGVGADQLTIQSSDPNHYVGSYSYVGKLPTVPGSGAGNPYGDPPAASPWIYPVADVGVFGGDLDLNMSFSVNDGPYVDANTGDRFDISLVGYSGSLTITGRIYDQNSQPLYPNPSQDIVLLDIDFDKTTLLARVGDDDIFLVEGMGRVKTLLGYDASAVPGLPEMGVTFLTFFSEAPQGPIFTAADYSPGDDKAGVVLGRISGEAGVPEPAALGLLCLGALGLLVRRRR